jgi:hypothetical protein
MQEASSRKFLKHLLQDPLNFRHYIRRIVGYNVAHMTYGTTGEGITDGSGIARDYIDMAEVAQANFSIAATPNAYWIDIFPWCEHEADARWPDADPQSQVRYMPAWMPFAFFRRHAEVWRKELMELAISPFEFVKEQMVSACIVLARALKALAAVREG